MSDDQFLLYVMIPLMMVGTIIYLCFSYIAFDNARQESHIASKVLDDYIMFLLMSFVNTATREFNINEIVRLYHLQNNSISQDELMEFTFRLFKSLKIIFEKHGINLHIEKKGNFQVDIQEDKALAILKRGHEAHDLVATIIDDLFKNVLSISWPLDSLFRSHQLRSPTE